MADAAPARGKSKKFPSMSSPLTWALILGIAVAGGAYLLYRRNKAATPAAATPATTDTATATDYSGQIATLQAEVADLQSSFTQDEAADDKAAKPKADTDVTAPSAPSVTPRAGGADISWGTVEDAKAYELRVQGATGHGTGTSHYDRVLAGTHARVTLGPGHYVARVRAGASAANVHGPWSGDTKFTVPRHTVTRPRKPAPGGEGED